MYQIPAENLENHRANELPSSVLYKDVVVYNDLF